MRFTNIQWSILCIAMILIGCTKTAKEAQAIDVTTLTQTHTTNTDGYIEVEKELLSPVLAHIDEAPELEFVDLYTPINVVAENKTDKLQLVDSLKARGFHVTNWGSGPWENGPKMTTYYLTNGNCNCQVDKRYYTTTEDTYKVTERIKCTKINKQ